MTPRRPRPLCAICADREATTITDWECESGATRTIVACWPCLSPVPDPPEEYEPADLAARVRDRAIAPPPRPANRNQDHLLRDAVLQAVRDRGAATTADVREAIGMHTLAEQNHISVVLRRLVQAGALTGEEIEPGAPWMGRVYRPTGETPTSAGVAQAMARIDAMAGDFTARDVGMRGTAITILIERGVIECIAKRRQTRDGYVPPRYRRIAKERRRAS